MAEVANLGLGPANPYLGQQNPFLQANIDAASGDLVNNFNLATRPALNAAMVKSGSFGNSALGQLDNEAQSTLQKNLGALSNTARFNDYNQQQDMFKWQKGFDESSRQFNLGFGRNVFNDSYSQSRNDLGIGMGLIGGLAGSNATDVANSTAQQNTPLDYWKQFTNVANGVGQGYGSETKGTTSNPIAQAAGGAQLGNSFANWWNQSSSASTPAASSGGGWWA